MSYVEMDEDVGDLYCEDGKDYMGVMVHMNMFWLREGAKMNFRERF